MEHLPLYRGKFPARESLILQRISSGQREACIGERNLGASCFRLPNIPSCSSGNWVELYFICLWVLSVLPFTQRSERRGALQRHGLPFAARLKAQRFLQQNGGRAWIEVRFISEYCSDLYFTFHLSALYWFGFYSFPVFSFAHCNFHLLPRYFPVALLASLLLPRDYEHSSVTLEKNSGLLLSGGFEIKLNMFLGL